VDAAKAATEAASQRHVLPKNLRHAISQLNDGELDELFAMTIEEAKQRGRLPPRVGTDSTPVPRRPDLVTNRSPPTDNRRQIDIAEVH